MAAAVSFFGPRLHGTRPVRPPGSGTMSAVPTTPTDRAYLAGLATATDLGDLLADPVVLKPGAVASWRLTTSRGDFHVKRFARGDQPWLRQSLAASVQVERAA